MNIQNTPLFAPGRQRKIAAGFHNVGSGVLRASDEATIKKVEAHYGERCGHIPLDAERARILVDADTVVIRSQMEYLSQLFAKEIKAITFDELKNEEKSSSEYQALVVPYINDPETEERIKGELGAESWGLPSKMVSILKNKANFYQLIDELNLDSFRTPEYIISNVADLNKTALAFLSQVENLVKSAGVPGYPLGLMLRAAESDGNYGCCLVYEQGNLVIVVQDGDADHAKGYTSWHEALAVSQKHLAATMNQHMESRIVISRFLDLADSPGMSAVIRDGQVESLGWNGQLQKKGSKACIGTSTYKPKNAYMSRMQQEYEHRTAEFLETLLRKTAQRCSVDFASIRGVANIDIMIPGKWEVRLQKRRGQKPVNYLAECNPRWTNYTDAIMTVIGANRQEQTIMNMRKVIQDGISTADKYDLPENVDPGVLRDLIFRKDEVLKQVGARIICRMAKNPMGLIFSGNVTKAQQEVATIIRSLGSKKA